MPNSGKKGIILFIVIAIIFVASLLAIVILRITVINARLTHHQVSRIQAMYAARAGVVYALEKLRDGTWTYSPTNSCPEATPCDITDNSFPTSVVDREFRIIFCPSGESCTSDNHLCDPPAGSDFCVHSTVDYTYTP